MKAKFFRALPLILLLIFAIVLRFYKISSVPGELYIDEVAIYTDAVSVAMTGHDIHGASWQQLIFPSYGDYKMPVYIWFAAASVYFFGSSVVAIKLPSILAGIFTVLVGYFLTKEVARFFLSNKSKKPNKINLSAWGIATASILAVSPWSLLFSRAAFEGHLAQFLFGLSVLLQLRSLRTKSFVTVLFSVVCGVLATYTYYSVRFVWPVVFILLWLFSIKQTFSVAIKVNVLKLVIMALSLVGYFLLLLPLQRSPFYPAMNFIRLNTDSILAPRSDIHKIHFYRLLSGNTIFDRAYANAELFTLKDLLQNYSDNLSFSFLFVNGDPNLRHGTGNHGLFLLPMTICLLLGLIFILRQSKELFFYIIIWIVCALLPASVPENTPHALRSLNALLPFAILIGAGLHVVFAEAFAKTVSLKKYAAVLLLILHLGFLAQFLHYYFIVYPKMSEGAWYTEFSQVALEIENMRTNSEQVFVANVKDTFFLWMYYKGTYLQRDATQKNAHGFIHDSFDGVTIGKMPDEPKSGDIVATSEETWGKFIQKFTLYKSIKVKRIIADDGSIFIVTKLP